MICSLIDILTDLCACGQDPSYRHGFKQFVFLFGIREFLDRSVNVERRLRRFKKKKNKINSLNLFIH